MHRSHATFAHRYVLATSSSALRVHFVLDCASRDRARSTSSEGRAPEWRGIRFDRACSTGLLIVESRVS